MSSRREDKEVQPPGPERFSSAFKGQSLRLPSNKISSLKMFPNSGSHDLHTPAKQFEEKTFSYLRQVTG